MTVEDNQSRNPFGICTWQDISRCADCPIGDTLNCRFNVSGVGISIAIGSWLALLMLLLGLVFTHCVLPIILSTWVPFTILAAICIVVAIASCAYLIRAEDRFNLRKWGEEYRQYMNEVPAINFVRGLKS